MSAKFLKFFRALAGQAALCLLAGSLVPCPALGAAQTAAVNTNQAQQIIAGWARASDAELNEAMRRGNPEAFYVAGHREMDRASQLNREGSRWAFAAIANGTNLTEEEQTQSYEKWKDREESELLAAAQNGERGAQWQYGQRFSSRGAEHSRRGLSLLEQAASNNVVAAELDLGGLHYKAGSEQARNWLERAATHGSEPAQHRLARILLEDAIDVPKAAELLQAASDQGCKLARYDLALQYACGNGEPRHSGETPFALLRYAATNGLPEAAFAIAERLRTGIGTERDLLKANAWYIQAFNLATKHPRTDESEHFTIMSNMNENQKIMKNISDLLEPLNKDGRFSGDGIVRDAEFLNVIAIERKAMNARDPEA